MTVLIIIIIALISLVFYFYFYRRREKASINVAYIEALIALLENDDALATKKLKETVGVDSDLVDAYIRLGDLYRKQGDVSRALQIHQSLTVRPTLKKNEEKKVYYALVRDLLETSRLNKATSFLKEILKIDKNDTTAQQLILKIYEDTENYGDCIALYEEGNFKPMTDERHAFYYASLAYSKFKNLAGKNGDAEKEIVNLLKKALRISPYSLTALYYLGEYYIEKGDFKKARDCYNKIIARHPDHLYLIIPQFEKVYYELGLFDEIIPVYEKIFHNNPKNFSVGFALAELYEKKNDNETAREVYRKIADAHSASIVPRLYILKLAAEGKALREKIADLERLAHSKDFTCTKCHFTTKTVSMLCPQCRSIESFVPSL